MRESDLTGTAPKKWASESVQSRVPAGYDPTECDEAGNPPHTPFRSRLRRNALVRRPLSAGGRPAIASAKMLGRPLPDVEAGVATWSSPRP